MSRAHRRKKRRDKQRDKRTKAARKVLSIVELLENILLNAPPLQLFVLQRVNKQFRDTIAESTALRRKMCLEPSEATTQLSVWDMLSPLDRRGEGEVPVNWGNGMISIDWDHKEEVPIKHALMYLERFTKPFRLESKGDPSFFCLRFKLDRKFVAKQTKSTSELFVGEKCERSGTWKDIIIEHEGDRKNMHEKGTMGEPRYWPPQQHLIIDGSLTDGRTIKYNATFGDVLEGAKDMTIEYLEGEAGKWWYRRFSKA